MFRKTTTLRKFVELSYKDSIATIKLNNPAKRNALCSVMIQELIDSLHLVSNSDARLILLKSTGNVYSSGHDLKEMKAMTADQQKSLFLSSASVFSKLKKMDQIVIGQVDGVVAAAGVQLVTSCDMLVCSTQSTFATSGVKFGLFCHTPAVPLIRSLSSSKKAFEMLVTGDPITASEALQYGMVNYVVPGDQVESKVEDLCRRVLLNSGSVVGFGKNILYKQMDMKEDYAYTVAIDAMVENLHMHDSKEGLDAFIQKRKPIWKK
jgi:enoyl-CoA hydratase/carnithine racemase